MTTAQPPFTVPAVRSDSDARPLPSAEEIRAKNGFWILIIAFATVLFAFIILLVFSSFAKSAITTSDILAIFGAVTGTVGTLVGSYFGVSAANAARDASSTQLKVTAADARKANDTAAAALGQLAPSDAARITAL